jgi:hypothetical protein
MSDKSQRRASRSKGEELYEGFFEAAISRVCVGSRGRVFFLAGVGVVA